MDDFDTFLFEPPKRPPPILSSREEVDSFLSSLKIPTNQDNESFDQSHDYDNLNNVRLQGIVRSTNSDTDNPVLILQEGIQFHSDASELLPLMHKTMDALEILTNSLTAILYFVTQARNEIYQTPRTVVSRHYVTNWGINKNSTLAAYVAATKLTVLVDDVWVDHRFPLGKCHLTDRRCYKY